MKRLSLLLLSLLFCGCMAGLPTAFFAATIAGAGAAIGAGAVYEAGNVIFPTPAPKATGSATSCTVTQQSPLANAVMSGTAYPINLTISCNGTYDHARWSMGPKSPPAVLGETAFVIMPSGTSSGTLDTTKQANGNYQSAVGIFLDAAEKQQVPGTNYGWLAFQYESINNTAPTPTPSPSGCAIVPDSNGNLVANCPIIAPAFTVSTATPTPIPTATPTPGPPASGVMKANDFLNTTGVTTKYLWFHDETVAQLQSMLTYLGVRHTREDGNADTTQLQGLCTIHAAMGNTVDVLPWGGDLTDTMNFAHYLANCGALLAVEGKNEPNNFGDFSYNGFTCGRGGTYLGCAYFQRDYYAAVKADPILSSYPMFAETEPGAEPDNTGLQFLTIPAGAGALLADGTKYGDYTNLHNYVQCNGCSVMADNQAWNAEETAASVGSWDGPVGEFCGTTFGQHFSAYDLTTCASLPRVTTETGWPSGQQLSEDQRGKLFTSLYLDAAVRGWSYTFIYQIKDDGDGFGLYDDNVNPKLAATYIHNLTTILADTSSAFTPTVVNYTISPQPATVHSLLLQKSNGLHDLVIWDEAFASQTPTTITVSGIPAAIMYDIIQGIFPSSFAGTVTLTDHPVILEF